PAASTRPACLGGQLHWSESRTARRELLTALLPAVNSGLSSCLPLFFRDSRRSVVQRVFSPQPLPEYRLQNGFSSHTPFRELLPVQRTLISCSYEQQRLPSAPEPDQSRRRQSRWSQSRRRPLLRAQ